VTSATSPLLFEPAKLDVAAAVDAAPTQPAKRVYQTLDAWRGIASLWVVLFHASEYAVHSNPNLKFSWPYRIGLFGGLGVQIFFVISGYCIASSASSTSRRGKSFLFFTRARLWRIFPTMWAALVLYAAFFTAGNIMTARGAWSPNNALPNLAHQSLSYWFANLTLLQPVLHQKYLAGVCWTLSYELAFYGVVALTLATLGRVGHARRMLLTLHLLTIACLVLQVGWPSALGYPLDMWAQFGYGVFSYHLISSPKDRVPKVLALLALVLTVLLICTRKEPVGLMAVPSGPTFGASFVMAMILVAIYRYDDAVARLLPIRLLSAVGVVSYSLYLTHFLSLVSTNIFFRSLEMEAYVQTRCLVSIAAAVSVSGVFYVAVERWFVHSHNRPIARGKV
jgi:exopolysaccharide production protein ExoZ